MFMFMGLVSQLFDGLVASSLSVEELGTLNMGALVSSLFAFGAHVDTLSFRVWESIV